jgi:PilZ domain
MLTLKIVSGAAGTRPLSPSAAGTSISVSSDEDRQMLAPQFADHRVESEVTSRAATTPERRQIPRHRLRDAPATLEWCANGEQISCVVTMLDISGVGAAVLADRSPELSQTVWIRLESSAAGNDRLQTRVVATSAEASGKHIVRLHFTSWLPIGEVLELHEEHRLWQRYPARETRATLLWLDRTVEQALPGKLINISGGGAAVMTDAPLPEQEPIWLTLAAGSDPTTPAECRLVAISIDASGSRIARLRFVGACPMDLFELALHGGPSES